MPRSVMALSMKRLWLLLMLTGLSLAGVLVSRAQDTGQICVQAYADQNENGRRDEIDVPVSRGIAANLLNERGITIGSQLLVDAPYAADGLLCFDQLFAGEYRVVISSSEFIATTETSFSASVLPGSAPERIDFGVPGLVADDPPPAVASAGAIDSAALQTLLIAVIAAVAALVIMALLGLLIYFLVIRRRLNLRKPRSPVAAPVPTITDLLTQPQSGGEAVNLLRSQDPSLGSPLLFTDEDSRSPRSR